MAGGVVVSWMKYRLSGVALLAVCGGGGGLRGKGIEEGEGGLRDQRRSSNTYPVTGIMWDVVGGGSKELLGGNKAAAEPRLFWPNPCKSNAEPVKQRREVEYITAIFILEGLQPDIEALNTVGSV